MNAQIPTVMAALQAYGPAQLGPTKAKFTTKFQQSGIPMGEIITSKAPAQTFTSPRSIASIEILD